MVDDLQIRAVLLDPAGNSTQQLLRAAVVVADDDACDEGGLVHVIQVHFRRGDVELPVQAGYKRTDPAALLFQGGAAGQIEFQRQRADVHVLSLMGFCVGDKSQR